MNQNFLFWAEGNLPSYSRTYDIGESISYHRPSSSYTANNFEILTRNYLFNQWTLLTYVSGFLELKTFYALF